MDLHIETKMKNLKARHRVTLVSIYVDNENGEKSKLKEIHRIESNCISIQGEIKVDILRFHFNV